MSRVSNPNAAGTMLDPKEGVSSPSSTPSLERAEIPASVLFVPTDAMKRAKSKLRIALTDSLMEPSSLTPARAAELTENSSIIQWNKQPGFFQWLTDAGEQRTRIEYLFELALDAAEQLLKNTDPKAQGARLNAIKVVGELASKFPRQKDEAGSQKQLEQMDRKQLEQFLQAQGVVLEKRLVIDAPTPNKETEQ
jgi:hypothetical protein